MRLTIWVGLVFAAITMAGQARATTANELTGLCLDSSNFTGVGICFGYINGVIDMQPIADAARASIKGSKTPDPEICVPTGVTNQQAKDVYLKYFGSHPEYRHWPAMLLVMAAMKDAFPCS